MTSRKSYLILGRLPTSPLWHSIQSKYNITHIQTKSVSRIEIANKISSLPNKSYTFVCLFGESQHLYPINKELLGPLEIECFCKVGAGFDSVDVEYLTGKGTWVANAPNAVRVPTAEWTVSLILATAKGVGVADRNVRWGKWREGLGFQSNIQGMTLGVVGLGAIGKVYLLYLKTDGRK
jgi:lactate dehydrogenase-like 2-hydroxyacid dehydrogenase